MLIFFMAINVIVFFLLSIYFFIVERNTVFLMWSVTNLILSAGIAGVVERLNKILDK